MMKNQKEIVLFLSMILLIVIYLYKFTLLLFFFKSIHFVIYEISSEFWYKFGLAIFLTAVLLILYYFYNEENSEFEKLQPSKLNQSMKKSYFLDKLE